MARETVARIAHGAGNRPERIERALAAGVDMLEVDVRFRRGVAWVRHEHRLPVVPVLYNRNLRGIHVAGPYALRLGPHFFRLDVRRTRLAGVIERCRGRAGLLIDLKAGPYRRTEAERFVAAILGQLAGFPGEVDFCGSHALLRIVQQAAPGQAVHFSIDGPAERDWLVRQLGTAGQPPGISIHPRLLDDALAARLRAEGVDVYCWDVEDGTAAERALALGASGIIADNLELLRALAGRPVRLTGAA